MKSLLIFLTLFIPMLSTCTGQESHDTETVTMTEVNAVEPSTIESPVVERHTAEPNVIVQFAESSPDRFTIVNIGDCDLSHLIVEIDLNESDGGVVFSKPTSYSMLRGDISLFSTADYGDASSSLLVAVDTLSANDFASFTTDLNDSVEFEGRSGYRVSMEELQGGVVRISDRYGRVVSSEFGELTQAKLDVACGCSGWSH